VSGSAFSTQSSTCNFRDKVMPPTKSAHRILSAGILATGLLCGATAAQASLVLDASPGLNFQVPCFICGNSNGATLGWAFTLTSSITVDGLGVWDSGSNGLGRSIQAGLWTGTGTLLASTTVTDGSTPVASASASGRWLFNNIPALKLDPGNYLIGSIFFNSVPTANIGSFTTIPEITNVDFRIGSLPNGGFQAPFNTLPVPLPVAIPVAGPTLRTQDVPPPPPSEVIPEIDALAGTGALVLLTGVLILAGERRRKS
jgi:hypothetical protein